MNLSLNPNGADAAGADFGTGDDPRGDRGLIARLLTADPREHAPV